MNSGRRGLSDGVQIFSYLCLDLLGFLSVYSSYGFLVKREKEPRLKMNITNRGFHGSCYHSCFAPFEVDSHFPPLAFLSSVKVQGREAWPDLGGLHGLLSATTGMHSGRPRFAVSLFYGKSKNAFAPFLERFSHFGPIAKPRSGNICAENRQTERGSNSAATFFLHIGHISEIMTFLIPAMYSATPPAGLFVSSSRVSSF